MTRSLLAILFCLLLALPLVSAAESYKPYLHKPSMLESPGVRLFGQYNTLLFPGAATYSYPVEVPQGTHGLTPSLVLSYNSQAATARSGVLGSGWAMNQNYIYRDVNGTPNNAADDKFLLAFENNLYELLYSPQDGLWHTEVEYHFRIQNTTSTANTYGTAWVVTTPDGTQHRMGADRNSEVTSNQGRNYATRWNSEIKLNHFQGNESNFFIYQQKI